MTTVAAPVNTICYGIEYLDTRAKRVGPVHPSRVGGCVYSKLPL
jgi:hypothetical protein